MASTEEYEVVWNGGPLTGDACQDLYQMQMPGRRNLITLGLARLSDGADLIRDASVAAERQLRPTWRKEQKRKRRKVSKMSDHPCYFPAPQQMYQRPDRAKLTVTDVKRIRAAYANGEGSFKLIGQRFGVSGPQISAIVHRDQYRDIS